MCGFIGIISEKDIRETGATEGLEKILGHRGPDARGHFKNKDVLFIHNRLSIIDLHTEADQPMVDTETGNVLVFNGEIYNYQRLKERYADIPWTTHSDSEVILKLYNRFGRDFVNELNGIFAFAIYDKKQGKVILYRDRFGVKPLYYLIDGGSVFFSSEIKGILQFKDPGININTLYAYLEYGMLIHNRDTFFDGIHALEPAHFLDLDLKTRKTAVKRYWDIPDDGNSESIVPEEGITEKTLALLEDSVRLNLVSDVEVGLSLSSGVDSRLLLRLLKKFKNKITAFTHGFEEKEYDEVSRIEATVRSLGVDFHPVYLSRKDMFERLKEAIYYFETPLGGVGTLSIYNMMKEVRRNGNKVMLTGEGADEVFGGYKYYYPAFFKDIEQNRDVLDNEVSAYAKKHNNNITPFSEGYNRLLGSINTDLVLAPDATGASITHVSDVLRTRMKKNVKLRHRQFESVLKTVMYKDLTIKKLPKLLHFQDRCSMANAVESRVPYLDHNFVSFMYSLPPEYKIKNGQNKYLLRKILKEKYGFDQESRVKHYVAAPQREWLKDVNVRDRILETVKNGKLVQYEFIEYRTFEHDYMHYAQSKELGNSFFVWKIINLEYLLNQKWK